MTDTLVRDAEDPRVSSHSVPTLSDAQIARNLAADAAWFADHASVSAESLHLHADSHAQPFGSAH